MNSHLCPGPFFVSRTVSLMVVRIVLIAVCGGQQISAQESSPPASAISTLLNGGASTSFGLKRTKGIWTQQDIYSHYSQNTQYDKVTFDISNGTMLANMGAGGALRTLTAFRGDYRATTNGWPGVWMAKDCAAYGSYAFTMDWNGQQIELAARFPDEKPRSNDAKKVPERVDWDMQTGLLDNLFPMCILREPEGRFVARLLLLAPVTADGRERPQGVIYGLLLENTGKDPLKGTVNLPQSNDRMNANTSGNWAAKDPFRFETAIADAVASNVNDTKGVENFDAEHGAGASADALKVAVDIAPGKSQWIPALLYQPDEAVLNALKKRSSLEWIKQSNAYYRRMVGKLTTQQNPWLGEYYERQYLLALQSLCLSDDGNGGGRFVGTSWGSYEATRLTWMKDAFYSCLPLAAGSPDLAQQSILWFARNGVRPRGTRFKGGVSHSISISLASAILAGRYYQHTADKDFFVKNPHLRTFWEQTLQSIFATRQKPDVWLFPSVFISDGACKADYHTGSNIAVWYAVESYARLLKEVYNEPARAAEMTRAAEKIKAAILARCTVEGAGGLYLNETASIQGPDKPFHDGEESETTLAPVLGLMAFDDPLYTATMRFAMSPANPNYNADFYSLRWNSIVPSTSPGYVKALGGAQDKEALWGEHGAMTELRRVCDADGSVWWWSYGMRGNPVYGQPQRAFMGIGKAGWTAGVFCALFPEKFLGVRYDAPTRVFRWAPLAVTGSFRWEDVPFGKDRFSIVYEGNEGLFRNTSHPVRLELVLPATNGEKKILLNGLSRPATSGTYLGQTVLRATIPVPAGATMAFKVVP